MSTVRGNSGRSRSRKRAFISDERGAVAFEMPLIYLFLITGLLLPMADIAIAGFRFVSAWGALRAFGQSIQYNPPPDVTNASSWASTAAGKADSRFPIGNLKVLCGESNAVCTGANTASPKYYSYTTSVTLAPMVLTSVLCATSCTFTLSYSERFQ